MVDHKKVDWRKAQPAPTAFARLLRGNFAQIRQTGIYNDRNVAGTNLKSSHAEGRAVDIHLNAFSSEEKGLGDELFHAIIRRATSIGVANVIWNRHIWSQLHGGPRPYTGENPHTDHLHVEFTRAGSQVDLLHHILIDIAIIRTGLEDLSRGRANIG